MPTPDANVHPPDAATPGAALSWKTKGLALAVAALADTVGSVPGEALPVVFDIGVALLLAWVVGFRALLVLALLVEAIPGVGLFPSWIAAVAAIVVMDRKR